jgi:hypothetical protein
MNSGEKRSIDNKTSSKDDIDSVRYEVLQGAYRIIYDLYKSDQDLKISANTPYYLRGYVTDEKTGNGVAGIELMVIIMVKPSLDIIRYGTTLSPNGNYEILDIPSQATLQWFLMPFDNTSPSYRLYDTPPQLDNQNFIRLAPTPTPTPIPPNGDDLMQLTPYGDAWVALSKQNSFASPTRWGWLGFKYDADNQWFPLAGDVNGDTRTDLVQITPYGDVWVSKSSGYSFGKPSRWGWLGFIYNKQNGWYPLMGDVNGDGKADLIEITPYGDAWVSLSDGSKFSSPSRWGWLGFKYDPDNHWFPLTGNFGR